jgi:hypothetical protein
MHHVTFRVFSLGILSQSCVRIHKGHNASIYSLPRFVCLFVCVVSLTLNMFSRCGRTAPNPSSSSTARHYIFRLTLYHAIISEVSVLSSRHGQDVVCLPALWPTQPPFQQVREAHSPGIKHPDRLTPSSAEVKNGGAIPPLPHTSSWCEA